jgi:hypothetical protein
MVARRDEITAQRDQSMKGDDQSSASSSVQSMTPPQAVNTSNSEPPGKTPRTAPPKTPANNTKAANAVKVTPSSPTNPDATTKAKSSLKPSSYGKSSNTNPDHQISKAQELLDLLNSTSDDGLEYNVDRETVFANLILEPKDKVHPWILASEGLQELLEVARTIDTNFAVIPTSDSMADKFPPLTEPGPNFPSTPITLGPYVSTSPNQMILVKPGSTYADGTPKKQPTIYATVRFVSTFATRCIMQWVSPELDMRGIGFNSRLYLMGTRHEFCPLGLMHDVSQAIKMEVKADAKNSIALMQRHSTLKVCISSNMD